MLLLNSYKLWTRLWQRHSRAVPVPVACKSQWPRLGGSKLDAGRSVRYEYPENDQAQYNCQARHRETCGTL